MSRPLLATLPNHIPEILFSFLLYTTLSTLISPFLSSRLLPRLYPTLPARTRTTWHIRTTSTVQSLLICVWALFTIFTDADDRSTLGPVERLTQYSPAAGRIQAFAMGYFVWDVGVSVVHFGTLGVGSLLHGVLAGVVTGMGFRPFANYYGINFILYELSTPFLNFHWFMDKSGFTGSLIQVINGVILLGTFFGCRVGWGLYQSVRLYSDARVLWREQRSGSGFGGLKFGGSKVELESVDVWIMCTFVVSNTVLSGLNLYWFGLMVRSFWRRVGQIKEKTGKETNGKMK